MDEKVENGGKTLGKHTVVVTRFAPIHFFFGLCRFCARLIRCLNAVSVAGEPNSVTAELRIAAAEKFDAKDVTM